MTEYSTLEIFIALVAGIIIGGAISAIMTDECILQDVPTMKLCAVMFPCNVFQLGMCEIQQYKDYRINQIKAKYKII